jgi:hypothetical protein
MEARACCRQRTSTGTAYQQACVCAKAEGRTKSASTRRIATPAQGVNGSRPGVSATSAFGSGPAGVWRCAEQRISIRTSDGRAEHVLRVRPGGRVLHEVVEWMRGARMARRAAWASTASERSGTAPSRQAGARRVEDCRIELREQMVPGAGRGCSTSRRMMTGKQNLIN